MTRAAAYLRASTDEQDLERQRADVERLAADQGLVIVKTYKEADDASPAQLDPLREGAQRGGWQTLLVGALDRLGPSMASNFALVIELDRRGIRVLSARESWLGAEGPSRQLMLDMLGWFAEQERERAAEEARAVEPARRRGAKGGRPRRHIDLARARALRRRGDSWRTAAEKMDVPKSTLQRALAAAEEAEGAGR